MAKITVNEERCKGCELCVAACPKHIIALTAGALNSKGYHPAGVEEMDKCTGCASCATMCPDCAITVER
ncbi:MAG: 4Fe-4S dicluster domain-containing protein [Clostridiales bacterium]|nr:4Fe-4S dicluster domain-containing protein [Clostridiales bacterium]